MIINPHTSKVINSTDSVVFLAGPVQGAPDWQNILGAKLIADTPSLVIATPRLPEKPGEDFIYLDQVTWEKKYLKQAAKNGCVVFWWCARDLSLEYEEGRAYAQTTRFEFGRILGWKDYDEKIKVVVGIDPNYKKNGGGSEGYIREMCREHKIAVHDNLYSLEAEVIKITS